MCNLCRRVEVIRTIDSKPLKPLIILISKLHQRMEPNLGDALLRREERIHAIRKRLRVMQVGPLRSLVGAIIADLESELGKIEVSKVDHPAFCIVGKLDDLEENIRPDESSSVRMGKIVREEGGRGKDMEAMGRETRCKVVNHRKHWQDEPGQDHAIYDLHPPPETIEYSIQLVDEWFTKHGGVLLSEELLHIDMEYAGI